MTDELFFHIGALVGGAVTAGIGVWALMRRFARGAADSQALREVRAVEKKHGARLDGLDARLQVAEQNYARFGGTLEQINRRLDNIWDLLTKK